MIPNAQSSSDMPNTKSALVDRAKQLAASLLSERSQASGALVARQLHDLLGALDASDRHGFQRYLATEFQPDEAALRAAALADDNVRKFVADRPVRRVIIVPGKLVNVVV